MASPVADAYIAPSGVPVNGGRYALGGRLFGEAAMSAVLASGDMSAQPSDLAGAAVLSSVTTSGSMQGIEWPDDMLDLLVAAPSESWVQVSANRFDAVWPPSDYRAPFGLGISSPKPILIAWSSFAWDDTQCRLILWGGGHANTNDNSVYQWDALTRQWSLAFWPSDTVVVTGGTGIEPVDGPLNAPQSSHTYGGQQWLPILQRFVTFGGAASSSGGPFKVRGSPDRNLGCYTLDMSLANLGYVGGTTGSNPHRGTSVGVDLPGAQAWYARDWYLDHPAKDTSALNTWAVRTNNVSAYRVEGGKDVVYFKCGASHLYRIQFNSHDYLDDQITWVGQAWDSGANKLGGDIDTTANLFVCLINGAFPISGWNLNTPATTNRNFRVTAANLGGPDAAEFLAQMVSEDAFGLLFDPAKDYFVAWSRGGRLYALRRPTDMSNLTLGWTVTKICTDAASPRPRTLTELQADGTLPGDSGVGGKWKMSSKLGVYIGLQDTNAGQIWCYKPLGWTDPRS